MEFSLDHGAGEIAILMCFAAIGGFMRGFAGFGTTLSMVPLFTFVIEPAPAVLIGMSIDAMSTIPLVPRAVKEADWKPVAPILIGGLLATPIGVYILLVFSADSMRIAIASMVIISALMMLSGWSYQGRKPFSLSFFVGLLSGTAGTATSVGGPPIALYLLAGGTPAKAMRASLNCFSFIKQSFSVLIIVLAGGFGLEIVPPIVFLLPAMLGFTWVGTRIFLCVSDTGFRKFLLYFLITVGIALMVRTFYAMS